MNALTQQQQQLHQRSPSTAAAAAARSRRSVVVRCGASAAQQRSSPLTTEQQPGRRELLAAAVTAVAGAAAAAAAAWPPQAQAAAAEASSSAAVEIVRDSAGFGAHPVGDGDVVLLHVTGRIDSGGGDGGGGAIFDTTRPPPGLKYRDGGRGVLRPLFLRLSADNPQPGVTPGLLQGLAGMRVGGLRVVRVPPELGFGLQQAVLAPYAVVPPGSALVYELELVRAARSADSMMRGVAQCGAGGASAATDGCAAIEPAEFF